MLKGVSHRLMFVQPFVRCCQIAASARPQQWVPLKSAPTLCNTPKQTRELAALIRIALGGGNRLAALRLVKSSTYSRKVKSISYPPSSDSARRRLLGHCYMHGLLRIGQSARAARFAEKLLSSRLRVNPRTFDSIVHISILQSSGTSISNMPCCDKNNPSDETVLSSRRPDRELSSVLHLLASARKNGYWPPDHTYSRVIKFCSSTNNLVSAVSLIEALARSSRRKGCNSHLERPANSAYNGIVRVPSSNYVSLDMIRPVVDRLLFLYSRMEKCSCSFAEASIVSSMLSRLLQEGLLDFSDTSRLVKALYSFPRQGYEKARDIYELVHSALVQYIRLVVREGLENPLNLHSYNSLLYYSIRHRQDYKLAFTVIRHMYYLRNPPITPEASTYAIIARGATLLRDNKLAKDVIECFYLKRNATKMISPTGEDETQFPLRGLEGKGDESLLIAVHMSFLTANGEPHRVVTLAYQMFPHLARLGHPRYSESDGMLSNVHYAAKLGPIFLSTMLNAIVKAGKTGLATRFWRLFKNAESAGRDNAPLQGVNPWRIPVHAYTTMMQLYATERRRGLSLRRNGQTHVSRVANQVVRGWGSVSFQPVSRPLYGWRDARAEAFSLYLDFMSTPERRGLKNIGGEFYYRHSQMDWSQPDARFFNVALSIFGRHAGTTQRPTQSKLRPIKARYRRALRVFLIRGSRMSDSDSRLTRILKDMLDHGFGIPLAYREFALGMSASGLLPIEKQPIAIPYSYPLQTKPTLPKPFHLHTLKTKGKPPTHPRREREIASARRTRHEFT